MVHLVDLRSRFIRLSPAGQGVTPKVPAGSGLQCPARVDTEDHGVCRPGGMSGSTLDADPFHTDQADRKTVSPDVLAFWGAAPPNDWLPEVTVENDREVAAQPQPKAQPPSAPVSAACRSAEPRDP